MALHTNNGDWDAAVELFNGEVIHAYQNGDIYGTDKMIFAAKTGAETWNYPVVQPSAAVNEVDGADVTDTAGAYKTNANDITTRELGVDAPLKDIRLLPLDQIEVRPELRLPDNYARMLGRSLAEGKALRITGLLTNAGMGLAGAGSTELVEQIDVVAARATSTTELGDRLKLAFNGIAAGMDATGIPSSGRHIMLKSEYWYELLGQAGIFTKEYGGQANVQAPGEFISYANFAIHNGKVGFGVDTTATPYALRMPAEYEADMTNIMGVAWHEESWAMRHWVEPTMMNDWVPLRDSFKLEARLTMGMTWIQDAGIYAIEDTVSGLP